MWSGYDVLPPPTYQQFLGGRGRQAPQRMHCTRMVQVNTACPADVLPHNRVAAKNIHRHTPHTLSQLKTITGIRIIFHFISLQKTETYVPQHAGTRTTLHAAGVLIHVHEQMDHLHTICPGRLGRFGDVPPPWDLSQCGPPLHDLGITRTHMAEVRCNYH
jgi:hypothetical protein